MNIGRVKQDNFFLILFQVECKSPVEGANLVVTVDQLEKKIKPSVKHVKHSSSDEEKRSSKFYEITFVPESEATCKIEIEYIDGLDTLITGNTFSVVAKAIDFLVKPYPLDPLPINVKSMFTSKPLLRFLVDSF